MKADGSGFMAAILPTGMRAVSTEISPETGAGGFILPNDRVDVILSRREKNPDPTNANDIVVSEIILTNIRVLAIDQAPKEKDGQNSVVGKTVTLELKPSRRLPSPRRVRPARCRWRCAALPTSTRSTSGWTTGLVGAAASTWFATASEPRPRYRSDQNDARDQKDLTL